jgi:hypothetical protein
VHRTLLRAATAFAVLGAVATAQTPNLAIHTIATFDPLGGPLAPQVDAPGPFFRSELLQIDVTGATPYAPLTLLLEFCGGSCGAPSPTPVLAGCTFLGSPGVNFAALLPIFAWDGLGCFGTPVAGMRADAAGALTTFLLIPTPLPIGGNASLRAQVATAPPPQPGSTGLVFVLGQTVAFSLSDPPPVVAPTSVSPSFYPEGTPTEITLGGSAILRSTVAPVVRFVARNGGAIEFATNVRVVFENGAVVVKATAPAFLGAPTAPPVTSAGVVDVVVDYAAVGLFDAAPSNGSATTAATSELDPTFFVFQALTPPATLSSVSPMAGPLGGLSNTTLSGGPFLRGSTVTFDPGGVGEVALTPACSTTPNPGCTIVTATTLLVDAPPHALGLVPVRVRGPDHLTASPRESAPSPSAAFAYFDVGALAIAVDGTTPTSVDEGLGTVAAAVTGACAEVGGYALLDPRSGPLAVRLGYVVSGATGSIDVTPSITAITTPNPATPGVPGSFRIDLDLPALPPGLNPPGLSGAIGPGLTNTGVKHFQIAPATQFGGVLHQPLATIAAAEPNNRLVYRGPTPSIASLAPNDVGRADGGQRVRVTGAGFFTQQTSLSLASAGDATRLLFGGFGPTPIEATFVALIDEQTIDVDTPDVSALVAAIPATLDVVAENVDGKTSVPTPDYTTPDGDPNNDFHVVATLGDPLAGTPFVLPPGTTTLDTGTLAAPNVFFFGGSFVLPAGSTLKAEGEAPLVLRIRGDATLAGVIDLRGGSIVGGTYGRPAGAGLGGAAADPTSLSSELPLTGRPGQNPASSLVLTQSFGGGGAHDVFGGGGGGGGAAFQGALGAGIFATGGLGGLAFGFVPSVELPTSFLDLDRPVGGAGGGAGGVGVAPGQGGGIFFPGGEPSLGTAVEPALNGAGGNGGGALHIACDGTLVLTGSILVDGADGGVGGVGSGIAGGGGGGGAGGVVLLQAIQRLDVAAGSIVGAQGGQGGLGGQGAFHQGGAGGDGAVRFAIPLLSGAAGLVLTTSGATIAPAPDTTGF